MTGAFAKSVSPKVSPEGKGWPHLSTTALRGPAAEFLEIVSPESEADPAGLLLDFLAASGSYTGPGPHDRRRSKTSWAPFHRPRR